MRNGTNIDKNTSFLQVLYTIMLHHVLIHPLTISKWSPFLNKELPNNEAESTLTDFHKSRIVTLVRRSTGGSWNTKSAIVMLVFTYGWNQRQSCEVDSFGSSYKNSWTKNMSWMRISFKATLVKQWKKKRTGRTSREAFYEPSQMYFLMPFGL